MKKEEENEKMCATTRTKKKMFQTHNCTLIYSANQMENTKNT